MNFMDQLACLSACSFLPYVCSFLSDEYTNGCYLIISWRFVSIIALRFFIHLKIYWLFRFLTIFSVVNLSGLETVLYFAN